MVYSILRNIYHYFYFIIFYLENKINHYFLMPKGKFVQFKISEYYKHLNFGEKIERKKTEELKVMGLNVRKIYAI